MLKITKFELGLIPDVNIYICFEKGTRECMSYISDRHIKTNNRYLKSNNPEQELKYILSLDINNLYSYVMSKFLPISELKWIDPKEFDLNKYTSNSSKRCVLEINVEYPKQ